MPLTLTFPIDYAAMRNDDERALVRAYADSFQRADHLDTAQHAALEEWNRFDDSYLHLSDAALRALFDYDVRVGVMEASPWGPERLNALEALLEHIDDDRIDGSLFYERDERCGCLYGCLAYGVDHDEAARGGEALAHRARERVFGSADYMSVSESIVNMIASDGVGFLSGETKARLLAQLRAATVAAIADLRASSYNDLA